MDQQPKEHIPLWWDAMWWILAILAVASALCGCFPKTSEQEAKEQAQEETSQKKPTALDIYEDVLRREESFRKFLRICEPNGGIKDFKWDNSLSSPWYGTKMTCENGLIVVFNGTKEK